jgi:hypothetical protein
VAGVPGIVPAYAAHWLKTIGVATEAQIFAHVNRFWCDPGE